MAYQPTASQAFLQEEACNYDAAKTPISAALHSHSWVVMAMEAGKASAVAEVLESGER